MVSLFLSRNKGIGFANGSLDLHRVLTEAGFMWAWPTILLTVPNSAVCALPSSLCGS